MCKDIYQLRSHWHLQQYQGIIQSALSVHIFFTQCKVVTLSYLLGGLTHLNNQNN